MRIDCKIHPNIKKKNSYERATRCRYNPPSSAKSVFKDCYLKVVDGVKRGSKTIENHRQSLRL